MFLIFWENVFRLYITGRALSKEEEKTQEGIKGFMPSTGTGKAKGTNVGVV